MAAESLLNASSSSWPYSTTVHYCLPACLPDRLILLADSGKLAHAVRTQTASQAHIHACGFAYCIAVVSVWRNCQSCL